jgi:hypothetical protein
MSSALAAEKSPEHWQNCWKLHSRQQPCSILKGSWPTMPSRLRDDIAKKISSTEGAVHADETYWTLDGARAYYWVYATTDYVHFQFDTSRCGQVSRDVLGEYFFGTLVTDCYAG